MSHQISIPSVNESTSTQKQAQGSICLPLGRSSNSQVPENPVDSNADGRLQCSTRDIVSYLLDNSAEFRKLNDLRQKASDPQPNYYTLC